VTDHKNMILAIALSLLVLIGWNFASARWFPTANPPVTKIENGHQVPVPQTQAGAVPNTPAAVRDRALVLRETQRVAIRTPRLAGSINLTGARIDDLLLTGEHETIDPASPPVRLFSPAGAPNAYFAGFGWTGQGAALPGPATIWTATGGTLTPATPVTLSWNNNQGQVFEIQFGVDANYLLTVEQRVINRGAGAIGVRPFSFVSRIGPSPDPSTWTAHVGPVGVFNGNADYGNKWDGIATDGRRNFTSQGGWIGFTDKYWLAALVPDQGSSVSAAFSHNAQTDAYQADYAAPLALVPAGQANRYVSHLFAGAKEGALLQTYSDQLGTPLERAIDWGWFRWFMKPIFALLLWLYAQIGNFGFSIICLTLIVRTLLFPIAQKQFKSMAAMRAIQPKMKALQEKYADDRMTLQQEMMRLYKEEKANPAAGCLPTLLQIPIFYALYKVLMVSVEMRHKPFIGWIQDLSAPDPLTPVNLFGYLPFTPPHFLALGVLSILLGITMWLQMRLNPQVADPVQRQVFALMPWVLMFVMANFAAGLQLYWVTNNCLTILQQRWLYSRNPALRASAAGT
jgi:YidC/Oxa1 family membrane protein insertase